MAEAPSQCFHIPLFGKESVTYSDSPESELFIVKCTTNPYINFKCWGTREGWSTLEKTCPDDIIPDFDENAWRGGFVNGWPMIKPSMPIFTCTGLLRPQTLFRVIHDQQPHRGLKARGHGLFHVTPWLFQTLVTRHLNWRSRHLSPFISTTDDWEKVRRLVKTLLSHGHTGLQVVIFHSSGPGWDHKAQRLFHVPTLLSNIRETGHQSRPYNRGEYLLESHIPPESIIEMRPYQDFPDLRNIRPKTISKKRKRVEELVQDREEILSTKRSTGFKPEY